MSESERKHLIDQILTYPANTYSREYLELPHPKTSKPYSNAELREYLEELRQAAKPVRTQTVMTAEEELYRQEQVSIEFLIRHKDFNNCKANIGLIQDFFRDHRLEWSLENLEKAFSELKQQLAPVPGSAALGVVPTAGAHLAPELPPPVPAPAVQPAVEPLAFTMEEINKWDGPTMRQKMANPVTRKQIDAVLAVEAELSKLAREQDQKQQMRENQ